MNKNLIKLAMLFTTSAAYSMQFDETTQKRIAILKEGFSTLTPIVKENSKGVIHAYLSPGQQTIHIFVVDRYGNDSNSYKRFQMCKDQQAPTLYRNREMSVEAYDQAFQSFETMAKNQLVTKLPLGDY